MAQGIQPKMFLVRLRNLSLVLVVGCVCVSYGTFGKENLALTTPMLLWDVTMGCLPLPRPGVRTLRLRLVTAS